MTRRKKLKSKSIFHSALDLFTLLALMFIGVSFMVAYGIKDMKLLDLPAVTPDKVKLLKKIDKNKKVLTVRWSKESHYDALDGEVCSVEFMFKDNFSDILNSYENIPCWPYNFSEKKITVLNNIESAVEEWTSKQQSENQKPPVAINCQEENLLACGRLQWLMAQYGFHTMAHVEVVNK